MVLEGPTVSRAARGSSDSILRLESVFERLCPVDELVVEASGRGLVSTELLSDDCDGNVLDAAQ